MTARRWSLANRVGRWALLMTTVPLAVAFVVGGLFLERSISREIEALVQEEVEEAMSHLRAEGNETSAFGQISRRLASDHPTITLAWRIFDPSDGHVLAEYGQIGILGMDVPSPVPTAPIELGDGQWTRTVAVSDTFNLGLVLDGASLFGFLHRYWAVSGGLFALVLLVVLIASRVLANRITVLLRGVAESVGTEHSDDLIEHTLPEEIREVTETLHREFRRITDDSEKIKLFTAGLAHELRSPIQNLIGQTEVALMAEPDPASYRPLLSSQLEELSDLADAVDNLLTICTIEPDNDSKRGREVFNLAEEAQLRLTRERTRGSNTGSIDVRIRATGNTSMAGDREHVLRGLRNVVANAVDWSPRGGRVGVSLDGDGEDIVVTIDDDGPGVPVGDRMRIFEPFVQGTRREHTRIGYGLGLAIAKASVEGHGGRIVVDSSPSGGARFRMTFRRGLPA